MKHLADEISSAMMHNSGVFLRKAAEEISGHNDIRDEPFNTDRATLIAVLIQTAVELAATASVLKYEGFAGVVRAKHLPATDAEIRSQWEAGSIRTLTFEEIKGSASRYLGDDAFWSIVDFFQKTRNKLVHFHAPLVEGDRFDMKYDATHVLIQVIAALTRAEEHEFGYSCYEFLGRETFDRLLSFEPYRERIAARARESDPKPLTCPICDIGAYLRDEESCLACGRIGEVQLLKCKQCRERAVFYDHLNLPLNAWLKARCGRCDWEGRVAHCATCDIDYLIEGHGMPDCPWSDDHE